MSIDVPRINRILQAVASDVDKAMFEFNDDEERDVWDQLVIEVAGIRARGGQVAIINE